MMTASEVQFPIGRAETSLSDANVDEAGTQPTAIPTAATTVDSQADLDVPASSRWDRATKRTVSVLLVIVFGFILWLSLPVLPIVIISALVAYLLNPIVDICERIHIPRSISTIVLFLLLFLVFILLPVGSTRRWTTCPTRSHF
jgi:predicted histidine transporter YuiF (NhaC family)